MAPTRPSSSRAGGRSQICQCLKIYLMECFIYVDTHRSRSPRPDLQHKLKSHAQFSSANSIAEELSRSHEYAIPIHREIFSGNVGNIENVQLYPYRGR